ncbi:hypothetical protein LP123_06040 [Moraxella bovis]|uniref:hypothetical protein n=1 Tax=Moraxella bovis TaxID=476 RepID=UPI002226283B|nr:hypothetical protein [Moraxella bovis]UYZ67611.1 hypothetical protein LP122_07385 [Moraxella bovis]UZA05160.1 hypothetical protein LP099_08265 [Moraxella bovis]UZA12608.1 hypothetical protein LP123_06040 [Moraxella bovis]UZA13265.1 hypothetical protein LP102_07440 [Moraxella bovis]
MKIKYLKPAPNATTGDVKDINTAQAKILIQLGFAEAYDENDSDNDNGDLFGQLDDSQSTDSEPPATDQKPSETDETAEPVADDQAPSETDEVSEQVQEIAENTPAEPATPTETAKPKKTKKTDTGNN